MGCLTMVDNCYCFWTRSWGEKNSYLLNHSVSKDMIQLIFQSSIVFWYLLVCGFLLFSSLQNFLSPWTCGLCDLRIMIYIFSSINILKYFLYNWFYIKFRMKSCHPEGRLRPWHQVDLHKLFQILKKHTIVIWEEKVIECYIFYQLNIGLLLFEIYQILH